MGASPILVVTNRDDLTADWLILELERRKADFVRFNTEDYPQHIKLTWRATGATLALGQRLVDLSSVPAVWFRRPVPPRLGDDVPPRRRDWAEREAREALEACGTPTKGSGSIGQSATCSPASNPNSSSAPSVSDSRSLRRW